MFKASGVFNEHSPGFAVQSFQKLTVFINTQSKQLFNDIISYQGETVASWLFWGVFRLF